MQRMSLGALARAGAVVLLLLAGGGAPAAAAPAANDPVYAQGLQWGLERIGAPQAWATGKGAGITIAIVDSGIDLTHEDLAQKVVANVSCVGAAGDPGRCKGSGQDDNGHGTHVAGIAAAVTDNGKGIAGVAPDAKLMAVRVLANQCTASGCSATGTSPDVAAGIRWAADHGADVINLSLGASSLQNALGCSFCDAIDYAWSKGAVPVIAAGNDSLLPAGFGSEPAVVVTATTRDDGRASYSNSTQGLLRGARWPLAAPGGEGETNAADCATGGRPKGILSTYWVKGGHDEYACLAGTSMAAPHVAGAIALLLGKGLGPQAAVERLIATAHDLGPAGRDPGFGLGLIDVAKAMGAPAATSTTAGGPAGSTSTTAPRGRATTSTSAGPTTTVAGALVIPTTTVPGSTPVTEPVTPLDGDVHTDEAPGPGIIALATSLALASGTASAAALWRTWEAGRRRRPAAAPPRHVRRG